MRRLHLSFVSVALLIVAGLAQAQQADVDALCQALKAPDVNTRAGAAKQLAGLGPDAADAVEALIAALRDPDARVRAYASYALGEIGKTKANSAVQPLLDLLKDENAEVRRAAFRALRSLDPPPEQTRDRMLELLETSDPAFVAQVLQMIAAEGKDMVPRLCEALKDERSCYWACLILADIGPDAADAAPELLCCLDSEQYEVRLNALVALGEIGVQSKEAQAKAVDILKNEPVNGIRYAAAFALGKIGAKNDAQLNRVLVDASKEEDPILNMICLWSLARLNPGDEQAVRFAAETIVKNLTSDDPQVRAGAARALAGFHGPPEIVAPELVKALRDADPHVVGNALEALATLGPDALPQICRGLSNPELRHYAARIIFLMGAKAADAVPAVQEALKTAGDQEDDAHFRRELLMILAQLGPQAKTALPALIETLNDKDPELRRLAALALGRMGPAAREAVPKLREQLREQRANGDPTPIVWALLKILPDDRPIKLLAIPLLRRALSHPDEFVRAEAAKALGEIGRPARAVVGDLKPLVEDESPVVRDAATAAITALQQ